MELEEAQHEIEHLEYRAENHDDDEDEDETHESGSDDYEWNLFDPYPWLILKVKICHRGLYRSNSVQSILSLQTINY